MKKHIFLWVLLSLTVIGLIFSGICCYTLYTKNAVLQQEKDELRAQIKELKKSMRKTEADYKKQLKAVTKAQRGKPGDGVDIPPAVEPKEDLVISVWSFTDEVPTMIQNYIDMHPNCGITMASTIIPTTNGTYLPALDTALLDGGPDAPDIYVVEEAFAGEYIRGVKAGYAMPYAELGIDVEARIEEADISRYCVEFGTNSEDELIGLGYQGTNGVFAYRRSIAEELWGTSDPNVVASKIGAGTGKWDNFFETAELLKEEGYAIVSGEDDVWKAVENSADKGWICNGDFYLDPQREMYLDYAKKLHDNGYTNGTTQWSEEWFYGMQDRAEKPVFGYFGPAWLINYTLEPNCGETYGDWAICAPPVDFFWGGTWVLANEEAVAYDEAKREAVKKIIEWMTLDCSADGLQYSLANGYLDNSPECVISGTIMSVSDGQNEFLGGQNMFDVLSAINQNAAGNNITGYDETINAIWLKQVRNYINGYVSREKAISDFFKTVEETVG